MPFYLMCYCNVALSYVAGLYLEDFPFSQFTTNLPSTIHFQVCQCIGPHSEKSLVRNHSNGHHCLILPSKFSFQSQTQKSNLLFYSKVSNTRTISNPSPNPHGEARQLFYHPQPEGRGGSIWSGSDSELNWTRLSGGATVAGFLFATC